MIKSGLKRLLRSTILAAVLPVAAVPALTGCGQSAVSLVEGKTNVVASFYPLYYMAKEIGGEHAHVINLVPTGVEPHDWSPKSRERKAMGKADVFVYNGLGMEGWVDDFLGSLDKDAKLTVVEASKGADLLRIEADEHGDGETKDGHDRSNDQAKADDQDRSQDQVKADDHGRESDDRESEAHEHGHEHESGYDPHVWVSPLQAKKIAENIRDGLVQADPAHKADYEANYNKLAAKLDEIHRKYKDELDKVPRKEIVVSHDAFGYLARDYGLVQMPIMGLAPDAEPTAQDMKRVSEFVKEHQMKYIFFEELVSDKLAKTLANDAGVKTLVLNPLEGLTEEQEKSGETYLSLLEANLQNLLKALK